MTDDDLAKALSIANAQCGDVLKGHILSHFIPDLKINPISLREPSGELEKAFALLRSESLRKEPESEVGKASHSMEEFRRQHKKGENKIQSIQAKRRALLADHIPVEIKADLETSEVIVTSNDGRDSPKYRQQVPRPRPTSAAIPMAGLKKTFEDVDPTPPISMPIPAAIKTPEGFFFHNGEEYVDWLTASQITTLAISSVKAYASVHGWKRVRHPESKLMMVVRKSDLENFNQK